MSLKESKRARRTWVCVNYLSLVLVLVFLYAASRGEWQAALLTAIACSLALTGLSFVQLHVSTGLWKLVHTKVDNLDERQLQVIHAALRLSYIVFAIVCLSFFLVTEVLRDRSSSLMEMSLVPVIAAFIYVAHTLPASVIAWTEKEI